MKLRELGRTGMQVTDICLGTMTWGRQNNQEDGFAQMDLAVESGINFFDTAELYSVPPSPDTFGATETIIGNWFKERGGRDKIILASKIACMNVNGQHPPVETMREGSMGYDKKNIHAAVDASLKRLQTDYLDLYQLHWPERPTNFFGKLDYEAPAEDTSTPIEETLDALDELVKAGKIRAVGLSNETAWGAMKFLQLADAKGLPRVASIQNPYSLVNRTYEIGLAEVSVKEDCGLLAYSPLAFGVLSGKYLDGAMPKGARLTLFPYFARYISPWVALATQRYVDLAKTHGLDPAQMALAFVNMQPFVTSNIIGATTIAQLKDNIASVDITLSDEVLAGIAAIHKDIPNPAP